MPTRVSLRRVGADVGKVACAPNSLAELLALATRKLQLDGPATRIFTSTGDELDDDDDVQLIREDEVLFASCGEAFCTQQVPPPTAMDGDVVAAAVLGEFGTAADDTESPTPSTSAYATSATAVASTIEVEGSAAGLRAGEVHGEILILRVPTERSSMAPELYEFCSNPDKYLNAREAPPKPQCEPFASAEPAPPPPLPPLLMGEWSVVPVPPGAKLPDGCSRSSEMLGLKPWLSALKKVHEHRQVKAGIAVWEYPAEAVLLDTKVNWHDFRALASVARLALEKQEDAANAAAAAAKEATKTTNDFPVALVGDDAFRLVCQQRDRARRLVDELEAENKRLKDQSKAHQAESRRLQADNLRLHDKNEYLRLTSMAAPMGQNSSIHDIEEQATEGRYKKLLRKDRQQRYADLAPPERLMLNVSTNRHARWLLFVYFVCLHLLVSGAMYLASHHRPYC